MEYNQIGDSIECQESEVISRKFSKGYPKKPPNSDQNMMFYKCTLNTTAEITKELNPKAPKIDSTSAIDEGDYLNAKNIELWVDRKRRFKEKEFELPHKSASHKARKINIKDFNFAKIILRLDSIPERRHSIAAKKQSQ